MIETILIILLLFPSMLGLAELLHLARNYILLPKTKPKKTVIVYLNGEKSVEQLMFVLQEYRWHGDSYAQKLAAVDYGIPDDIIDECREIAEENNILFYTKDFLKINEF